MGSASESAKMCSLALTGASPEEVRTKRKELGVVPSMKRVDTCAAEFEAVTPYMYSSYDGDCECESTSDKKVLILGGGPNRIGQGIEFDYCCCHASFALRSDPPPDLNKSQFCPKISMIESDGTSEASASHVCESR